MAVSVVRADRDTDPDVSDIAALEPSNGDMLYWASGGTRYNTTASQSYGRSLLNTANVSAFLTALGMGSGWAGRLQRAVLDFYASDYTAAAGDPVTHTAINAARAAAATLGGCVVLPPYQVECTGDVTLSGNYVEIRGQGGGSILNFADGYTLKVGVTGTAAQSPAIRDLRIVHEGTTIRYGIDVVNARNLLIENVYGIDLRGGIRWGDPAASATSNTLWMMRSEMRMAASGSIGHGFHVRDSSGSLFMQNSSMARSPADITAVQDDAYGLFVDDTDNRNARFDFAFLVNSGASGFAVNKKVAFGNANWGEAHCRWDYAKTNHIEYDIDSGDTVTESWSHVGCGKNVSEVGGGL